MKQTNPIKTLIEFDYISTMKRSTNGHKHFSDLFLLTSRRFFLDFSLMLYFFKLLAPRGQKSLIFNIPGSNIYQYWRTNNIIWFWGCFLGWKSLEINFMVCNKCWSHVQGLLENLRWIFKIVRPPSSPIKMKFVMSNSFNNNGFH